ncbi:hypothetical protein OF83DRAFT_1132958, partial [Amylostereum chailletii]
MPSGPVQLHLLEPPLSDRRRPRFYNAHCVVTRDLLFSPTCAYVAPRLIRTRLRACLDHVHQHDVYTPHPNFPYVPSPALSHGPSHRQPRLFRPPCRSLSPQHALDDDVRLSRNDSNITQRSSSGLWFSLFSMPPCREPPLIRTCILYQNTCPTKSSISCPSVLLSEPEVVTQRALGVSERSLCSPYLSVPTSQVFPGGRKRNTHAPSMTGI